MAVNTAYVASAELLERVAHRYRLDWLLETSRRASLYRIHLLNAALYTAIILVTRGSQAVLAEMYAIGLLASFVINIGCLLVYRFFRGTKEIREYYTSRLGTLLLWLLLVACFFYLAAHKPHGTAAVGHRGRADPAGRHPVLAPLRPGSAGEAAERPCRWRCCCSSARRTGRCTCGFAGRASWTPTPRTGYAIVTLFLAAPGHVPKSSGRSHYRFPDPGRQRLRQHRRRARAARRGARGRDVTVHFGWPTSSWIDRMVTGVFVHNLMRLPPRYPQLHFAMECPATSRGVSESPVEPGSRS